MKQAELENLVNKLRALPQETAWVEFKVNNADPVKIGQYISSLSNSAIEATFLIGLDSKNSMPIKPKFSAKNSSICHRAGNQEFPHLRDARV